MRARLRGFENAPESVQRAFWRRLRDGLAVERDIEAWLSEFGPVRPTTTHRFGSWDESWGRRARAVRAAAINPEDDWTPDRLADPLVDIPARVYVEALTGEDVPAMGSMCCPLPDHDDRNPSFRVYSGTGWRCFGCGKSGSIYDLASLLWDVPTRGRDFVELHKRLRAVFA